MSKKDEALRLARQLISNLRTHSWTTSDEQFVLKAIDEALAEQPAQQQEPVAWVQSNGELVVRADYGGRLYYSEQNLYTSPPASKPLTDEEIVKITADPCLYIRGGDYRIDIARAIEAAHGIKE